VLRRLTHRLDERPLTLLLVLPTDQDRAPLRTALSIATGHRGRIRALCLSRPGEALPPELRIALYGLSGRSEADLAIQHLVASSNRGAHVIISPVASDEEELLAEARQLAGLDPGMPLVVGWSRTGPLPRIDRLRPLVDAFKGPVVLLVDDDGPLPTEVLGLLPAPKVPEHAAVQTIVRDLERTLPAFFVREDQARAAVADCTAQTLVVAGLPPGTELESAVPGRLLLVLAPSEERTELVVELIEKVSQARQSRAASAAAPPPPPPAP